MLEVRHWIAVVVLAGQQQRSPLMAEQVNGWGLQLGTMETAAAAALAALGGCGGGGGGRLLAVGNDN